MKDVVLLTGAGQIGMAIDEFSGPGSDFLADGGATASYYYGKLQPKE